MSRIKPHDQRTKTSIIEGHMAAGDWRNAIRVAARLPRLDKHRCAILDAQGAYENPGFYAQIGKDAATLIDAGAAALRERFGRNQESNAMPTKQKVYTRPDNATRAAKAIGLSGADVYKARDGLYRIRTAALKSVKATAVSAKVAKPQQFVDESMRDKRKLAKLTAPAKSLGKRAAVLAAAQAGKLPAPLDFSAATHARYRDDAKELVALAKAGNIEALKRLTIEPKSSSRQALARYRDLALIALEARRHGA